MGEPVRGRPGRSALSLLFDLAERPEALRWIGPAPCGQGRQVSCEDGGLYQELLVHPVSTKTFIVSFRVVLRESC